MFAKSNNNQNDMNEVFRENFKKYFQEAEKTMPQYLQSFTKLQEEFLDAWKNTVETSLNFQKEYADKSNINTTIPEDAANVIYNMAEEYFKANNIQNRAILSALDSANNNFKNSKDTLEPLVEINKKILEFWSSLYSKK